MKIIQIHTTNSDWKFSEYQYAIYQRWNAPIYM